MTNKKNYATLKRLDIDTEVRQDMAATGNTGRKQGNRSGSNNRSNNKSNGRSNTRSRQTTNRKAVQEDTISSKLLQEILLIMVFALCVFLFLCNFGLMGSVGGFLKNLQFGIFGLPAYIAPILIFVATVFYISNEGSPAAVRKLIAGIFLYLLAAMLCELLAGRLPGMEHYSFVTLYKDAVEHHNGGGVIAGSLAYLSYHYLSVIGTVLLVIVLGLICIVLLTERSLISGAKKGGRILAEKARSREVRYEEEYEEEADEEEAESAAMRRARLRAEKRERMLEREREQEERDRRRREELEERGRRRRIEQEERLKQKQRQQEERLREKQLVKEEKEDEKILRMNKKSRGVMLDTRLTAREEPIENRDDMHEIQVQDFVAEEEKTDYQKAEERPIYRREAEIDEVQEITWPEYAGEPDDSGNDWEERTDYSADHASVRRMESDHTIHREERKEPDREFSFNEKSLAKMPEPITEFSPAKPSASDRQPKPESDALKPDKAGIQLNEKRMPERAAVPAKKYAFPPVTLLKKGKNTGKGDSNKELKDTALHLQQTLETFGVKVTVTEISQGPTVTRFEMQPEQGVKVSKIVGLADDIKLNLAATDIRIEAPIPGKAAVGIEVPNKENSTVAFRDLIESQEYQKFDSRLAFAVGKDIGGKVVVTDIAKMPHMLIAGATGSGKSVCINTIIMSILYKAHPEDVKLIMIDPKVVELSVYNGIPHLLLDVVTDPKKAAGALHWGVAEMTERYNKFAEQGVRDLKGYNQKAEQLQKKGAPDAPAKMPQIVIIVDELADLMMVAPGEVEESICRLAQLARAAGIHLIIATQRPSVDVITGLIKANMPSRIAFAVSSGVDSRTILDMVGAEKLLGKGDMLFYPQGYPKPARIQGAFISDDEVEDVVQFLKDQKIITQYSPDIEQQMKEVSSSPGGAQSDGASAFDEYFVEAGRFIIEKDKASIGMLQRVFKIGFNRAARIMDQLCEAGVVGEEEGTKPRKVLMSPEQFESFVEESV